MEKRDDRDEVRFVFIWGFIPIFRSYVSFRESIFVITMYITHGQVGIVHG